MTFCVCLSFQRLCFGFCSLAIASNASHSGIITLNLETYSYYAIFLIKILSISIFNLITESEFLQDQNLSLAKKSL